MVNEIEKNGELFLPFSKENIEGELGKDFVDVLRMVAPGTSLRVALDDFLNAKMGALIVFDNGNLESIIEGGFRVNTKFSAQKLVELAKMDGAIILSRDGKDIVNVNTLLFTDISIYTKETGTRHKAAERTAKQAKTLVIAVSERKNKISLYYGDSSYQLQRSSEVLRRASETLQILEKQRDVFNELLLDLNSLELRRHSTVNDVCMVLQRVEIMKRISDVVQRYLIELGKEGIIVKMRLKELMGGLQKEEELILKDYFGLSHSSSLEILEKMDFDFLLEPMNLSRLLFEELHDKNISPKGIRLLGKTNLIERYVDLLVGNFENLSQLLIASNEELLELLGSEAMLTFFREEIYNLKEKINLGKGL
ncbi:DNA integrity scanning protein DisA [Candidatus Pacearchaeota archaeon CG09_land_8_20_14_0_10_30_9]|nr:DNA integrity scanning protein DisA [Candidatus Pacearchaeota archaeon]PIN71167.1 MAG: DNA integrity scanning protein DisA [Candidatus Pacearchaeota archaeon CG11_big_fil_rev_8_21_14_0_20_30_13]PIO01111.1 MAG: DNA integrity scanning protein DisA [Candidatus Pacearchaeota archaeon CG09_land_8_20_14_0_10_30_9]PIZ82015.1 MAG: DNA integrity scanning protein DisA [Candidatus Pacearchaeota archaeon CG_4_10_14_0_2_um_filter_30_11]PJA71002.1 MAG: DNA integrity scanning protein DisA [Candidatus Pacea